MSQRSEFHNLDQPVDGLLRELAAGVTTRIFSGEHAMLSVVTLAPHAEGTLHHHPEEQWGVLLDGSAIRVQGGEETALRSAHLAQRPVESLRANGAQALVAEQLPAMQV